MRHILKTNTEPTVQQKDDKLTVLVWLNEQLSYVVSWLAGMEFLLMPENKDSTKQTSINDIFPMPPGMRLWDGAIVVPKGALLFDMQEQDEVDFQPSQYNEMIDEIWEFIAHVIDQPSQEDVQDARDSRSRVLAFEYQEEVAQMYSEHSSRSESDSNNNEGTSD